MTTYTIRTEGAEDTIEAETLDDATEQAREWLREGWDDVESTSWVSGYLTWTDEDGDECEERVKARVDPPVPKCIDGERESHDWQSPHEILGGLEENPGVWGHGGGVIIREVCMRCGCERSTDTWAQDRSTGEQGLESVSYEPRKYADEIVSDGA